MSGLGERQCGREERGKKGSIRLLSTAQLLTLHVSQHTYVDQSPLVARRLGFASLPLAVMVILIGFQSLSLLFALYSDSTHAHFPNNRAETMVHLVKWSVMGIAFWLWWVILPSFADETCRALPAS
jgi:hypothetical protein